MKRILEPFDINKAKSGARIETGFGLKVDIVSYNYRTNKGPVLIGIAHQTLVDAIHSYDRSGVDITAPNALNNLFIVKYTKERSAKDISNAFKKLLQIRLYPKYGYVPTVDEIPKSDILFAVGRVDNKLKIVPVNNKYARFIFLTENNAKQFLSDNEKLLKVFFELD